MLIRVEHETRYRFSHPVFLEPQLVRLAPRADSGQAPESFTLSMTPAPSGQCEITDQSGNPAVWAWFDGFTREFTLISRAVVRTLRTNPFDYLLQPEAISIPLELRPFEREALAPFLLPDESRAVRDLTRNLALQAENDTVSFLSGLNDWIYRNLEITSRAEAGVQSPSETLTLGSGACRDAAVLFMAACRLAGIPARYVSGYQIGDPAQSGRELHAYPEAYLPGAGWRGFDPTLGLCVTDGHVALCAAHRPELTAPVTGTFRGNAEATLEHRIHLDVLE
jgi:transglutaminase-like putative cysteine protease